MSGLGLGRISSNGIQANPRILGKLICEDLEFDSLSVQEEVTRKINELCSFFLSSLGGFPLRTRCSVEGLFPELAILNRGKSLRKSL